MKDLERQWQIQQFNSILDESFEDKEAQKQHGKEKHG